MNVLVAAKNYLPLLYSDYAYENDGLEQAIALILGIFVLAMMAWAVVYLISLWKVFEKAGEPGWAAIVPIYNTYILFKITWGNGLYFLALFIPGANVIMWAITYYKLGKSFGRSNGYSIALAILTWLMIPFLAFSKSNYLGVEDGQGGYYDPNFPNQGYGQRVNYQNGYQQGSYPGGQGGYQQNPYQAGQGGYQQNPYQAGQGGYQQNSYGGGQAGYQQNNSYQGGYQQAPSGQTGYQQNPYSGGQAGYSQNRDPYQGGYQDQPVYGGREEGLNHPYQSSMDSSQDMTYQSGRSNLEEEKSSYDDM